MPLPSFCSEIAPIPHLFNHACCHTPIPLLDPPRRRDPLDGAHPRRVFVNREGRTVYLVPAPDGRGDVVVKSYPKEALISDPELWQQVRMY